MDRLHVGGEIYQATYILYQVKGEHPGMINKLNEILARPPAEVRVHNVNKGILHEYGLDDFIQIQHEGDYHGHDYDINDIPPGNWPKGIILSYYNFKDFCMSIVPK